MPPEQPASLNTPTKGGLGRAIAVAIVFIGGMYAIAGMLIGVM